VEPHARVTDADNLGSAVAGGVRQEPRVFRVTTVQDRPAPAGPRTFPFRCRNGPDCRVQLRVADDERDDLRPANWIPDSWAANRPALLGGLRVTRAARCHPDPRVATD
jgi:hypothetical protein